MNPSLAGAEPVMAPDAASLLKTAARLAAALRDHPGDEFRLVLLKRVARELADHGDGYPLFLKLILILSESSDSEAKRALADTLAMALRRADLPSGPLTSWGASSLWATDAPVRAGALIQQLSSSSAPKRQFGPIEYLTAWHCQRTHRTRLGDAAYADGLAKLVTLVNHNDEARKLYPDKLLADANNELEGVYTRSTRELLVRIAEAWRTADADVAQVVSAAVPDHSAAAVPSGWYLRDL